MKIIAEQSNLGMLWNTRSVIPVPQNTAWGQT